MRIDNLKVYGSQRVSVTAASAATKLTAGAAVMLTNIGTAVAYAKFGDASVAATNADVAIPPGAAIVLDISPGNIGAVSGPGYTQATYVALIGDAATTVNVVTGEGS